jgi:hypothetical protein
LQRSLTPTIDGLESRSLLSTAALVAQPMFVLGPSGNGNPPSGAFTPAQIEEGYGFNQISFNGVTGDGKGETIALVDAYDDPNIQGDLNAFDTEFGLPAITVDRVNQAGGMTYPAQDSAGDWELEESLDVEWAHAMAPSASIMLVEANADDDTDLLTAVAYAAAHANIVSMSWGASEFSGESQDDPDFAVPGVAFVASAGDNGAPASWPSASPNVLSVGGTALTLNAQNDRSSEVGWSGSGGGPSIYESQPAYQKGVVTQTTSVRATADVAYDASASTGVAVYDSIPYNGVTNDWIEVGGTSAGAPQWSALLAIADQGLAQNDRPALNSASAQQVMTILYQNTDDFHDITTGASTGSPHYSAGPGFDYVTGLGTPIANLVVSSLDGTSLSLPANLVLTAPTDETAGTPFSLTVTAENASGAADTDYSGTIAFSSSDVRAGLPPHFLFSPSDDGTYTFKVTLKTAGSQLITAKDTTSSAITGTLAGIDVSPAAASTLDVSSVTSSTTAGVSRTVTLIAVDPYGNVATGYRGTIEFTSTDPLAALPASYPFSSADAGTHSFLVTLETAGTQAITATDSAISSITGTGSDVKVQAAAAKTLGVSGFATNDTAGLAGTVIVTAYDAFGNVATGYAGSVALTTTDPHAVLPSSYTFYGSDAGKHSFSVTLDTSGTQSITAADTSLSSLSASETGIAVQAASAKTFTVAGFPSVVMTSASDTVTVTAYDDYGNMATGYAGTVFLTSTDPLAVLPSGYSFTAIDAGSHQFTVALATAGAQSITATDMANSSVSGSETGITVRAIPQITWSSPASIVYGTPLGPAQLDASANVAGTFTFAPAAGSILNAGSGQTLSVVFTPQNSTDYTIGSATTTIAVAKATPVLEVTAGGGPFNGGPYPASATILGAVAGVDQIPSPRLDSVAPVLTYYDGSGTAGTVLGSVPPSAPGTYTAVATFPGDANYLAAASAPVTFVIGQGAASISLTSTAGTSVYGGPVSLIATVGASGAPPSGTVTFYDGNSPLATIPVEGTGTATYTTSELSAGSHAITAEYSGDTAFVGVRSAPYSETVAPTSTEVVLLQTPVRRGRKLTSVRLTVIITPDSGEDVALPAGEVTLEMPMKSNKKVKVVTTLGSEPISGGRLTLTLKASKVAQKSITIFYSGDTNDDPSTLFVSRLI